MSHRSIMDVNNCRYDAKEEVSLPQFLRKYGEKLPMLIIVVGGYDGLTNWDDISSDTIMLISKVHPLKRALAADPKKPNTYISIPVNTEHRFQVIKSHKQKGMEMSLCDILRQHTLPVCVQFSDIRDIPPEGKNRDKTPANLLITHIYDEIYLQGNFLADGSISREPSSVYLSPNIFVAPVRGFIDKARNFDDYLEKIKKYAKKHSVYSESDCNLGIKRLDANDPDISELLNKEKVNIEKDEKPAPPVPKRGLSKKQQQQRAAESDSEGEEYIEMSNPSDRPVPPPPKPKSPNYENDKLCQVQPMPQTQEEDLYYDPVELQEQGYLEPIKMGITHVGATPRNENNKKSPRKDKSKESESAQSKPDGGATISDDTQKIKCGNENETQQTELLPQASGESSHVSGKTIEDIGKVLCQLKLDKYVNEFKENMVDGDTLEELNIDDLRNEFHFTKLEAVRLTKYVKSGHIPK